MSDSKVYSRSCCFLNYN